MKIGIVSDTHGVYKEWKRCFDSYLVSCDIILHCGDVLYISPYNEVPKKYKPKKLADHINNSKKHFIFSKGDCDSDVDQMALDFPIQSTFVNVYLNDKNVLLHHGHIFPENELIKFANEKKIDIIFSGRTHQHKIKKIKNVIYINPGSATCARHGDYKFVPTIAIWENDIIKIISVKDNRILNQIKA